MIAAVPLFSYVYVGLLAVIWGWLAKRRGGPGGPAAA